NAFLKAPPTAADGGPTAGDVSPSRGEQTDCRAGGGLPGGKGPTGRFCFRNQRPRVSLYLFWLLPLLCPVSISPCRLRCSLLPPRPFTSGATRRRDCT